MIDDGSNDGSREKCLFYTENNNKIKVFLQNRKGVSAARNNTSSKIDALKYCIETDVLTRAVWTKTIKRQLVIDCHILFPEGKRNEDTYFTGKLIRYANTFDWCDSATYMY